MEKIKTVETFSGFKIGNIHGIYGDGGARLGFTQMLNCLQGYAEYDGYIIETEKHTYRVMIDNGQSCCEDWGYMSSDDNLEYFVGADLREVNLTDTALNKKKLEEEHEYGFDGGGIQFVDFVTDRGVLQLAVYNGHNGYYGHGIVVAKDNDLLLNNVL